MNPWRVSKPGEEGTEARVRELAISLRLGRPVSKVSSMVHPLSPGHRSPAQTLVFGLCEGQETLHSHKIILLLIVSLFQ